MVKQEETTTNENGKRFSRIIPTNGLGKITPISTNPINVGLNWGNDEIKKQKDVKQENKPERYDEDLMLFNEDLEKEKEQEKTEQVVSEVNTQEQPKEDVLQDSEEPLEQKQETEISTEECIEQIQEKIAEVENRGDNYTRAELLYSIRRFWLIFDNKPNTRKKALEKGVIKEVGEYNGLKLYVQTSWLYDEKIFSEEQRNEIISSCFKRFLGLKGEIIQSFVKKPELWQWQPRDIWFYLTDNTHYGRRFHTFNCRDEIWLCNSNFVNFYKNKVYPSILEGIKNLRGIEIKELKDEIKQLKANQEIKFDF